MTRAQRIALAMRGFSPRPVIRTGTLYYDPAVLQRFMLHDRPIVTTKPPHTFSVYVRGPKGLPCL